MLGRCCRGLFVTPVLAVDPYCLLSARKPAKVAAAACSLVWAWDGKLGRSSLASIQSGCRGAFPTLSGLVRVLQIARGTDHPKRPGWMSTVTYT